MQFSIYKEFNEWDKLLDVAKDYTLGNLCTL